MRETMHPPILCPHMSYSRCFPLPYFQCSPVAGSFDLFLKERYAGELHMVVAFTYGAFGYGYSTQVGAFRVSVDTTQDSTARDDVN